VEDAVLNALIAALVSDEEVAVPRGAAMALGRTGEARAIEPLCEALREEHSSVRRAAALALGTLGDPRATEPLLQALAKDPAVWREAAIALGAVPRTPTCTSSLVALIHDSDRTEVRRGAALALGIAKKDPRAVQEEVSSVFEDAPGKMHVLM